MNRTHHPLYGLLLGVVLAGCAAVPPDRGRGAVDALLTEHGLTRPAHTEPTDAADAPDAHAGRGAAPDIAPLELADALHIALVNNPQLRARYAELGFAAAEVHDAGRLSNPRLHLGYRFVDDGALDDERSVGITQSFTELILMPARRRLADAEFARVQHAVAGATQLLAHEVADSWYELAAAQELAPLSAEIAETARIAADLAERFFAAGNLERRALAEARAAAATARLDALQADQAETDARARFVRLLGRRPPPDGWRIAAGLPTPQPLEPDPQALLAQADAARLDLAAARRAVAREADALGVTRQFRYLGKFELGPEWEWNEDGERSWGPSLALELPLFDRGAGKVARAEAELERAEAELAALEVDIVAEIERARAAVTNAHARYTQYAEVLLPARREIVARTQEEVNFMLTGPFTLLETKQHEYHAALGLLTAAQDYWRARVDLARATGQAPPAATAGTRARLSARALAGPAETRTQEQPHAHHGDHP